VEEKPKKKPASPQTGAAIIKVADKNGDGVLTRDEFDDKSKLYFESTDANGDGEVDATEIDAGLKRLKESAEKK
jgi:Ca2+-binding EF-hand superfamily protein